MEYQINHCTDYCCPCIHKETTLDFKLKDIKLFINMFVNSHEISNPLQICFILQHFFRYCTIALRILGNMSETKHSVFIYY